MEFNKFVEEVGEKLIFGVDFIVDFFKLEFVDRSVVEVEDVVVKKLIEVVRVEFDESKVGGEEEEL